MDNYKEEILAKATADFKREGHKEIIPAEGWDIENGVYGKYCGTCGKFIRVDFNNENPIHMTHVGQHGCISIIERDRIARTGKK